jgi:UDP-glucose 4-epimerase
MSKILVTGGCGFIGSILVAKLQAIGCEVDVLDSLIYGELNYIEKPEYYHLNIDIRDKDALVTAFKGYDSVIHLAAYGSVVNSVENPVENFEVNAQGTFNVLNAAKISNIERVIFASTGGALIGNASPPVNELSLPRPISPYGASKLAGEGYCSAFANAYDISVTALRFANVIGPNSWHKKGAVTAFFKSIMKNEPIIIYGTGNATRDFLFVEDLCNGIIKALDASDVGFNVYHLASGKETSVNHLAEISCEIARVPEHYIIHENVRAGEVERNFADYQLAKQKIGFNPEVEFKESMRRTWDWFQLYAQSI